MSDEATPVEATPPSSTSAPPCVYPEPKVVSPHITLQAPLSRRGKGPGLVLVLDHYALIEKSEKHLDPPPLQKWAEEGFAVVKLLVPGKVEDGGEFPLEKCLEILKGCEGCEYEKGVGLISYLSRIPFYIENTGSFPPQIRALVSYGGKKFTTLNQPSSTSTIPPQLIHAAGPHVPRRESFSLTPSSQTATPTEGAVKTYRYEAAKKDSGWVLPADEEYHKQSASIAHTRSLAFLKKALDGPWFDLEAIWEEHTKYEFGERDVEKTMATMVPEPYVNHIPTMTGGIGQSALTSFYTHHFIHSNPPDTSLSLISRTIGTDRVIDEFIFSLTHTQIVPWLLPGVPPTNKPLSIPFTSVVAMRGDRLCHEHISWDQGTVLKQAGLLPEWVRWDGEIEGREKGEGKRWEVRLPVVGGEGARKAVDEGCEVSNGLMEGAVREVDDV